MIRAQYTIIVEFQREGQSGKLDLLGVFDRIYAPAVPSQHRNLAFVVLLVTEDEPDLGKKPFRFYVLTPGGKTLVEQQGEIHLKPGGGTWLSSARLAFEMQGMPLPEYGKYRFILEVGGKTVAQTVLSVTPPTQAPPQK